MKRIIILRNIASLFAFIDADIRRDVFIGLTGLFVAILVFVAGALTKETYEIKRKSFIYYLKPFSKMVIVSITLFLIVFSHRKTVFLTYSASSLIRYILLELVIDIGFIISFWYSIDLFRRSINIISQHKVATDQLLHYITNRVHSIEKVVNKETLKFSKRKKLEPECENYQAFDFQSFMFSRDEYVPIYAQSKGHISKINFDIIRNISQELIKTGKASSDKKTIIFTKDVGSPVDTVTPVAYIYKSFQNLSANISSAFTISNKLSITIGEFDIIHNDLLHISQDNEFSGFQRGEIIYSYVDYLYQKNYGTALDDFFEKLAETYRSVVSNELNESYTRALSWIAILAKQNSINHYKQVCGLIKWLYLHQKDAYNYNYKRIACDYMNRFFLMDSLDSIQDKNYDGFSILMGDLLSMTCVFIKNNELDAIGILLNESHFEYNDSIRKDSIFECYLFQFAIGITHALMLQYNAPGKNLSSSNIANINKVYSFVNEHFIDFMDVNSFIDKFLQYYYDKTVIQGIYSGLELEFNKSEYSYSSSAIGTNPNCILLSMLMLLNIDYSYNSSISETLVSPEREYSFSHMTTLIDSVYSSQLIKQLNPKYDVQKLTSCIHKLHELATENHVKQMINTPLNSSILGSLYDSIRDELNKQDSLLKDISKLKKVHRNSTNMSSCFTSSFHVTREMFFESTNGSTMIAEELVKGLMYQIDISLSEALKTNCVDESFEDFESVLHRLNNVKDYVIITDLYHNHMIKHSKPSIKKFVEKNHIEILKSKSIDGILLVHKASLPDIIMTIPQSKANIGVKCGDSTYCQIIDYTKNTKQLDEAIANYEWLKEKGNEEKQREYLLQRCLVSLSNYISIQKTNAMSAYYFTEV